MLRLQAREIADAELASTRIATLVDDMIETMRDVDGAGLAAPQVYESIALLVVEVRPTPRYPGVESVPLTVLANPTVTPLVRSPSGDLADDEAILVYEGCLSVAGLRGRVRRPRKVRVEALGLDGRPIDEVWEGFRAAVIQHETDHLRGTLFVDRADPRTLTFLREYERYVPPDERVVDLGLLA